MSEKTEWMRAWVAPSLVVGLVLQGVTGVTTINGISNVAQNAEKSVTKAETRVQVLEANGVITTAKMAVMETQLASLLKLVERIDARMEARSGRNGG